MSNKKIKSTLKMIVKIAAIIVMYLAILTYLYNPSYINAYFISKKVRSEAATFTIKGAQKPLSIMPTKITDEDDADSGKENSKENVKDSVYGNVYDGDSAN